MKKYWLLHVPICDVELAAVASFTVVAISGCFLLLENQDKVNINTYTSSRDSQIMERHSHAALSGRLQDKRYT